MAKLEGQLSDARASTKAREDELEAASAELETAQVGILQSLHKVVALHLQVLSCHCSRMPVRISLPVAFIQSRVFRFLSG